MPDQVIEQDLIDNPNETLAVEYKSWLDLTDNEVRADLARHIAALANYGGGSIVFGFTDELKFAGPIPYRTPINRDIVAARRRRKVKRRHTGSVLHPKARSGRCSDPDRVGMGTDYPALRYARTCGDYCRD
jgi:hypothetical protein